MTRRTKGRVLTVTTWLALGGVLTLLAGTASATPTDAQSCVTPPARGTAPEGESELGLFLVDKKSFSLRFDDLRDPLTRTITIPAYVGRVPLRNLTASIEEDVVSAEGRVLSGFTVGAEIVSAGNPTTIRICLRLDPGANGRVHPGRYAGTVVLRGDNFQDAAIPLDATFRAARGEGLKMATAGVLLGLLVKMLTELGSVRRARGRPGKTALREYVLQWSFPLAIILGVVSGWLGFVEIYESSETWGVGDGDALKLFAACFGFQMGSIGGADMTKRLMG